MFGAILFEYARLMLWGSLLCTVVILAVSATYYGLQARRLRNRPVGATTHARYRGGFRGE